MEKITQSLAGRISLFELMPLSYAEIMKKQYDPIYKVFIEKVQNVLIKSPVETCILRGGFPEVITSPDVFEFWLFD